MNRFTILIIFVTLVSGHTSTHASEPGNDTRDNGGLIVQRNEQEGTTTIIVPARDGRLDWNDVFRGLSRAGRFDDQAIEDKFDGETVDLSRRPVRWSIRAISAAAPDVHLRIVDHPVQDEPALQIDLQRDESRKKIRRVKALIRRRFENEQNRYGLRLDDEWESAAKERPLVVLIHGYNGDRDSLGGLHAELSARDWSCGTFAYPNDGPVSAAAELLSKELRRYGKEHPDRSVALVAHSMGGLVARAVVENTELNPKNVSQLIQICTPNHGSPWAELPGGLDCWEYLRNPQEKALKEMFEAAIQDGLNEGRSDMKPGSKFLRDLNARDRNPQVRYSIVLGDRAPFTSQNVDWLHDRVRKSLSERRSGQFVQPRLDEFFEGLRTVSRGTGDGAVSIESGKLPGVEDIETLPIAHDDVTGQVKTKSQQAIRDAILSRLEADRNAN